MGFKLNLGRNDFFSSGQIPLDEVVAGRLDRFGFIDPFNRGRVRSASLATYYRKEWNSGATLKVDGFLARSLFDLYSNSTFFLNDQARGDETQQHDSRLQEGVNVQFLRPYRLFGKQSLLTVGGNLLDNQINVGLSRTVIRDPFAPVTSAHALITNSGSYVQNGIDLMDGHLHLEAGLRIDYFRFIVDDKINRSCFSQFDLIARKHKLEKFKTIGDAYMAVGGVPLANRTHAVDCVLAALEIEQLISSLREQEIAESRPYWQIRVGVHSGDLVAGVVGREKFSYDVWGDTVNTASRLESSGVAGRINISGATYELVREFFDCEFRGKIAAKNKGEIDMYFVNGIRPELSVGLATPNERFFELYQRLCLAQWPHKAACAIVGDKMLSTVDFAMEIRD